MGAGPYSERRAYGGDFSEAGTRVVGPGGPTYIYYSCFRVSDSHSTCVWLQASASIFSHFIVSAAIKSNKIPTDIHQQPNDKE